MKRCRGDTAKYQGTWVPLQRGIALAVQYNVDEMLRPLFEFDPTEESPPPAPKHQTAASTKAKVPVQRKPRAPKRTVVKAPKAVRMAPAAVHKSPLADAMQTDLDPLSDEASGDESASTASQSSVTESLSTVDSIMDGQERKRKYSAMTGEYTTGAPTNKYSEALLAYFVSPDEANIPQFLLPTHIGL